MKISRLRLRLAGGFALAFTIGLALLTAFGLEYLFRESTRRFDVHLAVVTTEVLTEVQRELFDRVNSTFSVVANEVTAEWPDRADSFMILDSNRTVIASYDPEKFSNRVLEGIKSNDGHVPFELLKPEPDLRIRVVDTAYMQPANAERKSQRVPVHIVTFGSTEGIESDAELLGVLAGISGPLIVFFSLVAGYVLAGRALQPVRELANSMSAIAPTDLHTRLNTSDGAADEVSAVAIEFNALLARLETAQKRNGQFVREAAHQIRTPLTLVLGEATHELANTETNTERMRSSLTRIGNAAERMRRRVDELMLLAEAQTGEAVNLAEFVELDGLVLSCADLMRPRASALGRSLAIDHAENVAVKGNSELLHEALLELLENAMRHGEPKSTVVLSLTAHGASAALDVTSSGPAFTLPARSVDRGPQGLGLPIVRWIAESHGGVLELLRDGTRNTMRIAIPLAAQPFGIG